MPFMVFHVWSDVFFSPFLNGIFWDCRAIEDWEYNPAHYQCGHVTTVWRRLWAWVMRIGSCWILSQHKLVLFLPPGAAGAVPPRSCRGQSCLGSRMVRLVASIQQNVGRLWLIKRACLPLIWFVLSQWDVQRESWKSLSWSPEFWNPFYLKPEFDLVLLNSLTLGSHGDIPYLSSLEPCFPTLFET